MAAHVLYVKRAGSLVAVNIHGRAEFGELPNVLKGPQLSLSPWLVSPPRHGEVKQENLENRSDPTDFSHLSPRNREKTISISSTASFECSLQNQRSSSESSMDFAHFLGFSDSDNGERQVTEPKFNTLEAHEAGRCRPCRFFWNKKDGCTLGDDCKFCHFCEREATKGTKRRLKYEARKQAARNLKTSSIPPSENLDKYSKAS